MLTVLSNLVHLAGLCFLIKGWIIGFPVQKGNNHGVSLGIMKLVNHVQHIVTVYLHMYTLLLPLTQEGKGRGRV